MKCPDFIDESIFDVLPDEFKRLDGNATYCLQKTKSKRENFFVVEGDKITGNLEIINVKDKYGPGVRVWRGFSDYMRTSPIVGVIDATENTISFETEGGFYTLTKVVEDAKPNPSN